VETERAGRRVSVWRHAARIAWAAGMAVIILSAPARAQETATAQQAVASNTELAKKLANPIADLVSVPFQFNWVQGVGPDEGTRFILNVQPVMPFSHDKNWNLITRVIVPFIGQPVLVAGSAPASGIGDILSSFFFSPARGKVTWGVGPVVSFPSTSEPTLGSGKWSMGVTGIVLKQSGPWTVGAHRNQA
jgi:hypothetical protein